MYNIDDLEETGIHVGHLAVKNPRLFIFLFSFVFSFVFFFTLFFIIKSFLPL
tara:strand:+ start:214 stop:369 length:156 start_codon:yes stop_codon:yes gene_type:complete